MTKIYGASLLINSLVILLIVATLTFSTIVAIPRSGTQLSLFVSLGICVLLIFLGYRFLMRSIHALKGDLTICLPETAFKDLIFYLGYTFLVLSAIIHVATFALIGYLVLTKTSGVPVGMGSGLGLLVFLLSVVLLGPTLKTHNNSLQPTGSAGG